MYFFSKVKDNVHIDKNRAKHHLVVRKKNNPIFVSNYYL